MSNPQVGTLSQPSPDPTPIGPVHHSIPSPNESRPDEDDSRRRGLPIWLFVLIVVVFAVALGWQFQVAGQLEQEISGLEQDLNEANAIIGAHQSRLSEIRTGVYDLAGQLEGLKALVDADPEAGIDGSAASETVEGSEKTRSRIPARLPQ